MKPKLEEKDGSLKKIANEEINTKTHREKMNGFLGCVSLRTV